jgi:acyl-coenzyme A synthetase/AMP-(fatty) acid ligase/acyl carrier protein
MLEPSTHKTPALTHVLLEPALHSPDAPALAWLTGEISYKELYEMAAGMVVRLDQLDIRAREPVAVRADKSPGTIALILACLLSGRPALLTPVELRPRVLDELLERAGIGLLLASVPHDGALVVEPTSGAGPDTAHLASKVCGEDVALLLTTSGSTGSPKVVPLTHGAIARFTDWASARFEIGPGTVVLNYCALSFDLSILELWTTLLHGGCAILVARERATHGEHLLDLVLRHEVEVLQGIPLLYRQLLDAAAARGQPTMPSVRHAILTGERVPKGCLRRLPHLLEHARLYSIYGCTETNDSLLWEIERDHTQELDAMPLGQPLPGVSALIVGDTGVVDGVGGGELWVSTPFQAHGYLGPLPAEDQFVADPLRRTRRIYFLTGDLVRRDANGTLFLEGRSDWQVKVRGVRVDLQAVEQAILEVPGVSEAAVVACDDPLAGKRLHALIRVCDGAKVDTLALRRQCARRLTRVAMPAIIETRAEPFPRTTTGKLDREGLKHLCERATMDTTTAITQFIVEQFAPDLDAEELDPGYDLLEAGIIDSLGLLTVLAWIEQRFELTVDAGAIGEENFRSVRSICALVESSNHDGR